MTAFDLNGRVALVTGSAQGLGFEMARALGAAGAQVLLNGRSPERLADAQEQLAAQGLNVGVRSFDVTNLEGIKPAVEEIEKTYGHLDILINNVGLRDRRSVFEFDLLSLDRMLKANLTAPFELARCAAQGMMQRKWGRIINMSSVVAQAAGNGDTAYTAVKGGLESLTRVLAAEFGSAGVTVNTLSPGFFATSANAERLADGEVSAWLEQRTALGRWAQAHEICGPAVFLASDAASYVTGHTLIVDGGLLSHL